MTDQQGKIITIELIVSALISGFLIIPIHEFGHVLFHWISGNPAGMSYARDYMLSDGKVTLVGVLGGLIIPILISLLFVIRVMNNRSYYKYLPPFIILASSERPIQYFFGITPSDEKIISSFLSLNVVYIKTIFIMVFILINSLLIYKLIKNEVIVKNIALLYMITFVSYVIMASFGIFIVERFLFHDQYLIQFG